MEFGSRQGGVFKLLHVLMTLDHAAGSTGFRVKHLPTQVHVHSNLMVGAAGLHRVAQVVL